MSREKPVKEWNPEQTKMVLKNKEGRKKSYTKINNKKKREENKERQSKVV